MKERALLKKQKQCVQKKEILELKKEYENTSGNLTLLGQFFVFFC